MKFSNAQNGGILILILVFSAIFLLTITALISLIMVQRKTTLVKVAKAQALNIAESGVNYYRWHLAHAPEDYESDTGLHDFYDPETGAVGQYNLEVTAPEIGSTIVTIKSTGWTLNYPNVKKIVEVRYGVKSLTDFAFLTNSNIWFGGEEEIAGKVHSNGGIRMDGECDSRMTSAKETYICGPEHACDYIEKPGIWGTGEKPELWDFPETIINFNEITLDLDNMKQQAIDSGIFLDNTDTYGYHIVFNTNSTFNVYEITGLKSPVWGYNGTEWINESNSINTQDALTGYQNVAIPTNGTIFVQDKLWVSGEVSEKVTVVAARLPEGVYPDASIIISDDITYPTPKDGSAVLALIAQKDILVPLYSPDKLEIDAVLLAQKGHCFRYYYPNWTSYPYNTYALRDQIETYGSIITNTIWTWSWVSSETGPVISGYEQTETTYDNHLVYGPPPYFPTTGEYTFISWEEKLIGEE